MSKLDTQKQYASRSKGGYLTYHTRECSSITSASFLPLSPQLVPAGWFLQSTTKVLKLQTEIQKF